jgi:hypothetical protein
MLELSTEDGFDLRVGAFFAELKASLDRLSVG